MLLILGTLLNAQAMAPAPFSMLQQRMEDTAFSSEQLLLISSVADNHDFTANQTLQLIEEIAFSKDQLQALQTLAPQITDIENYDIILDAFNFTSDKFAAQKILSTEKNRRERTQAREEVQRLQELQEQEKQRRRAQKQRELQQQKQRLQREQLQSNSAPRTDHRNYWMPPSRQSFEDEYSIPVQWVGHCPEGIYTNGTPAGKCIPLKQDLFDPFSSDGHQLLLQTHGRGIVTITMELGPTDSRCQRYNEPKPAEFITWKIPVYQEDQILDIGSMINDWNREEIRIFANLDEHSSGIHLKDWKKCQ